MKFKFKIQQYQTNVVNNIVEVFKGQGFKESSYLMDKDDDIFHDLLGERFLGYRNSPIKLSNEVLLQNINKLQRAQNIDLSKKLYNALGACELDIEMETGTGKTYAYIKTIFELNKTYGWTKFIIVVPSIAIREGVFKSFGMLSDHFYEYYQKQARYFIYNSEQLHNLSDFATSPDINVMIINSQAFASKEQRKIYMENESFSYLKPIDIIKKNNPIIILDEPQKLDGKSTQDGLKEFNPLFTMNFSATHKTRHNLIYALDAYDAYKQNLVKRIEVKGISVQNLVGSSHYLYFEDIILSTTEGPKAKLHFEIKTKTGVIKRICKILKEGDDLYEESTLSEYKNFVISDINPIENTITFINGTIIQKGECIGNVDKEDIQRLQIRETIRSHLLKESYLYKKGIKCLSLFFIDEVANYKDYKEDGSYEHGFLWKTFEDEYKKIINENTVDNFDKEYFDYIQSINVEDTHLGYFSKDKKGRDINGKMKKKKGEEDTSLDVDAYDLILKHKEALLDFKNDVRFIFSHSALREGWDNPNIFQICTLRNTQSTISKRQEVGRGLRLCVNKEGIRQDSEEILDIDLFHKLNTLTVVANESYSDFVAALQKDTNECLRDRVYIIDPHYFEDKVVINAHNEECVIDKDMSKEIVESLITSNYLDKKGNITDKLKEDIKANVFTIDPLFKDIEKDIFKMVKKVYDNVTLKDTTMCTDGNKKHLLRNRLSSKLDKDEFNELWTRINHQYYYTVSYDSDELIQKSIESLNEHLTVKKRLYSIEQGSQVEVNSFELQKTRVESCTNPIHHEDKYDLVGEIAAGVPLTRKSVIAILKGLNKEKLSYFAQNPNDFIKNCIALIKGQKASRIVEHIKYYKSNDKYDMSIFTDPIDISSDNVKQLEHHATEYLVVDSKVESNFAEELSKSENVIVYLKLPKSFKIPTPVGYYNPDWAISFVENENKHIYFIAETKGSLDSLQLSTYENEKIECAKKLYKQLHSSIENGENVVYKQVVKLSDLIE